MFGKRLALLFLVLLTATCASVPAAEPARRHDFPPVGKYQVMTGDFHMHTIYSDGKLTPRERVEESYRLGYDVIAVTDHRTSRAYRAANYVGSSLGLIVLRGLETGVAGNEHMNALGVSSAYVPVNPHGWCKKPNGDTIYYQDAMKGIADDGAFLIYNHPHCGYNGPVKWGVENHMVNGIEVKNDVVGSRWNTTEWHGIYCYPDAFDYALEHNLTMFADTDAHGSRNENPAMTLVLVADRSVDGVLDAFRNRRTAAWFQDTLWGRKDLLDDLLAAIVRVSRASDGKLLFDNQSPIALKARVQGGESFDIPAYQTTAATWAVPAGPVTVVWENVWPDPRTNLTTVYKF